MINYGRAICYSGFRGKTHEELPTMEETIEDLLILDKNFDYIRVYSPYGQTRMVLEAIRELNLHLKVLLGVYMQGEMSNPDCPWGGLKSDEEITMNIAHNNQQILDAIALAKEFEDIVMMLSAGNESIEDWSGNKCSEERIVEVAKILKKETGKPVTFCSSTYDWNKKMTKYEDVFDCISIHSYPVWRGDDVDKSFEVNKQDYEMTKKNFPNTQVIFTECGWPTLTNGHNGMLISACNEDGQKAYYDKFLPWLEKEKVIAFLFEAFDEPWKGGPDYNEPEKHWGIYNLNRTPKKVFKGK